MQLLLRILLLSTLIMGCGHEEDGTTRTEVPADHVYATTNGEDPFKGLGIRYDGYYMEKVNNLRYLIRFFDNGRAVLINGTQDVEAGLPSHLTRDAPGDPVMGWYNVPVTVQGDSIFFKTYPEKGEISYRGNVPNTSTVRLLRHSHINGTRSIKEYIFHPDASQ